MDWTECKKKMIVKEVKVDLNLIKSAREIAEIKVKSAEILPDKFFVGKITLLYDALREYLECLAIERGFRLYNHECYAAFIKEILRFSGEAYTFDTLRKIRNGINYYGKRVTAKEAKQIIINLLELINKFKE